MKVIESTSKRDAFRPFSFEITVESEDDLVNLWHRFNSNDTRYFEKYDYICPVTFTTACGSVFGLLDRKLSEANINVHEDK